MRKLILHILFLFAFSGDLPIYGQDDGLNPSIQFKKDTAKINLMLQQGFNFALNGHMDKAMSLALNAQTLSRRLNYQKGICKGMNVQSYTLNRQGNYDSALVLLKKALFMGEKLNDSALISSSMLYLANAYSSKGDHPTAIDYYFRGLKLEEKLRAPVNLHYYLNGIGVLFTTQKKLCKGIGIPAEGQGCSRPYQ